MAPKGRVLGLATLRALAEAAAWLRRPRSCSNGRKGNRFMAGPIGPEGRFIEIDANISGFKHWSGKWSRRCPASPMETSEGL